MARFGLCGPSYTSQSTNADAQSLVNWYLEACESQEGKSAFMLYPTPGTATFCTLSDSPGRGGGLLTVNGRMFAVAGATLFEVLADKTFKALGVVGNDGMNSPVSMACSPYQVLIASAGLAFVYDLAANIFTPLPAKSFVGPVSMVGYCDGYFVALITNSNIFQLSKILDAATWDLTLRTSVSVFPDNIVSLMVDHRELILAGNTKTVVYYNSGNADFPFDVVPGSYIEQGTIAKASLSRLDNSVFWIGGDDRGAGIGWRAQGYTPNRITNHAIEFAWQGYPTLTDAVAYSYQDQGHPFWIVNFPTANKTWGYDVATGTWHERAFLNVGNMEAHRGISHTFAFGKHLIGDRKSGKIFQMAIPSVKQGGYLFADDDGSPIRRVRRAPHVSSEQEWIRHHQIQVDVEAGLGLPAGVGSDPKMMLRWSDDAAKTWSNEYQMSAGKLGQTKTRCLYRRMGRSRDRVYEISASDPIPWRITDAYLKATPGFGPTERLTKDIGKRA